MERITVEFVCPICDKVFQKRYQFLNIGKSYNLIRHQRLIHNLVIGDGENKSTTTSTKQSSLECVLCHKVFNSNTNLIYHYENVHSTKIETESLAFNTFQEFHSWKTKIEMDSCASFVKGYGDKKNKDGKVIRQFWRCHRSGRYTNFGSGTRQLKIRGSVKINGFCPAHITVLVEENRLEVTYAKTHVGHSQQVGKLFLSPGERRMIASLIAAKVPFKQILEKTAESVDSSNVRRIHLLTKKDLWNIQANYNLNNNNEHTNTAFIVETWVREVQSTESSPVLFYKPQGSVSEDYADLGSNDFFLAIMTETQSEMLVKYGAACVCVDSTYKTQQQALELTAVLVVDDFEEGFPAAFLISSRQDEQVLTVFFQLVEKKIGKKLITRVFMSDLDPDFYNAWKNVMEPAKVDFYSSWNVSQRLKSDLFKISDTQKRAEICRTINKLLNERSKCFFKKTLESFVRSNEDPETEEFLEHFKSKYLPFVNRWASCYRRECVHLTPSFERVRKKLLEQFTSDENKKRIDLSLSALMKIPRELLTKRAIIIHKGKINKKLATLQCRKHISLNLSVEMINSNSRWKVESDTGIGDSFTVEKTNVFDCKCHQKCVHCQACYHLYTCTCDDYVTQLNVCSHIHFVCHKYVTGHTDNENLDVLEQHVQTITKQEIITKQENTILSPDNVFDAKKCENSGSVVSKNIKTIMKSKCNVKNDLNIKKRKLIKEVAQCIRECNTEEEYESMQLIVNQMKHSLDMSREASESTVTPTHEIHNVVLVNFNKSPKFAKFKINKTQV